MYNNGTERKDVRKSMPRTKGSKNKSSDLSIDERIAAVNSEIESLQKQVKAKKDELKKLKSKKEENDLKKIAEAIQASGKSVDEIIGLISDGQSEN